MLTKAPSWQAIQRVASLMCGLTSKSDQGLCSELPVAGRRDRGMACDNSSPRWLWNVSRANAGAEGQTLQYMRNMNKCYMAVNFHTRAGGIFHISQCKQWMSVRRSARRTGSCVRLMNKKNIFYFSLWGELQHDQSFGGMQFVSRASVLPLHHGSDVTRIMIIEYPKMMFKQLWAYHRPDWL